MPGSGNNGTVRTLVTDCSVRSGDLRSALPCVFCVTGRWPRRVPRAAVTASDHWLPTAARVG